MTEPVTHLIEIDSVAEELIIEQEKKCTPTLKS